MNRTSPTILLFPPSLFLPRFFFAPLRLYRAPHAQIMTRIEASESHIHIPFCHQRSLRGHARLLVSFGRYPRDQPKERQLSKVKPIMGIEDETIPCAWRRRRRRRHPHAPTLT